MFDAVLIKDLASHEGAAVTLRGWVYGRRRGGKVIFLLVRDGTGICQCVVEAAVPDAYARAADLPRESSLTVSGTVRRDERAVGGYEIAVSSLAVIQAADEFPIAAKAHGVDFLMSHRHLWLRSRRSTAILRIRHTLIRACRDFFDQRGFTLVDTPILSSGAGEDAQTLFPVEYFDRRVFLTQTGQLHLEAACMALGRVYCFGPTFRAEKSKTRRHLTEFWMIEPEVAFADLDEIVRLAEEFLCEIVGAVLERHEPDLAVLGRDVEALRKVRPPFARLTYSEAVENLRSDATRRRLEEELARDRDQLRAWIRSLEEREQRLTGVKKKVLRDRLEDEINELRENIRELEQDLANRPEHIRLAQEFPWGSDLGGSDETILSRQFDTPLFITDYPREAKAFYMKTSAADPRVVRNMDLLAPEGYGEIIGGSQREEDPAVLRERLRDKGLNPEDYAWYLDLRRFGTVPHSGFGLGLERTLAWICGLKHVRETIPFPRTLGRVYP